MQMVQQYRGYGTKPAPSVFTSGVLREGEVRYPTNGTNPRPSKYTFTGQYSYMDDPTTTAVTEGFGMMFYNARWYDPVLGRFNQPDSSIPQNQGTQAWDRYAYVSNNPLRFADPSGHGLCEIIQSLFGIALSCPSGPTSGALINVGANDEGGADIFVAPDPPPDNGWIIDRPDVQDSDPCICDPIENFEDENEGYDPAPDNGQSNIIAENDSDYPDLPIWQGGKTRGVLDTGSEQISLISGYNGPSSSMPDDAPGMSSDLAVRSHVEAHAAAIMRQQNLSTATLYINRSSPCQGPMGCDTLLPHMLPENSTLNVYGMDSEGNWSFYNTYHGLPDDDWPT